MPEDKGSKPGIIERIHSALGLKVSPEQQARIDHIRQAGEAANAKLRATLDTSFKQRLDEVNASAAASYQKTQAETNKLLEQIAHRPKLLGWVNDGEALKKAALDRYEGKPVDLVDIKNKTTVNRWYDGYGHIIYLSPDVGADQVQAVSTRIVEQQRDFNALGVFAKIAARTNPNSPYQDFFASDARRIKFQELKQPPA